MGFLFPEIYKGRKFSSKSSLPHIKTPHLPFHNLKKLYQSQNIYRTSRSQTSDILSPLEVDFYIVSTVLILALNISATLAGLCAYGVCQAGCATVVMACYGAAGFTWGATLGATALASIIACNTAFGSC